MVKPAYIPLCKECGSVDFDEDEYRVRISCNACGMEYTTYNWYNEDMEILSKAMLRAKKAFDDYLNNELDLDGYRFKLKLEGEIQDVEDYPMSRLFMDFDIKIEED